jgi:hypothetical protein
MQGRLLDVPRSRLPGALSAILGVPGEDDQTFSPKLEPAKQ